MPGGYLYGWENVNKVWVKLVCDAAGKLKIDPALILENPPTEDMNKKAATSEWCYDHWKNASAHHAKYTDLEAQTACKLNGNLYWSCAGIGFTTKNPATDNITKSDVGYIRADANGIAFLTQINVPSGATVTGIIVYGNAAVEVEMFYLMRYRNADNTRAEMATQNINTEDVTIVNPVIDNSTYSYFIRTSTLDTGDELWGAVITFTL